MIDCVTRLAIRQNPSCLSGIASFEYTSSPAASSREFAVGHQSGRAKRENSIRARCRPFRLLSLQNTVALDFSSAATMTKHQVHRCAFGAVCSRTPPCGPSLDTNALRSSCQCGGAGRCHLVRELSFLMRQERVFLFFFPLQYLAFPFDFSHCRV